MHRMAVQRATVRSQTDWLEGSGERTSGGGGDVAFFLTTPSRPSGTSLTGDFRSDAVAKGVEMGGYRGREGGGRGGREREYCTR